MRNPSFELLRSVLIVALFLVSGVTGQNAHAEPAFVTTKGTHFMLNGAPFFVAGINNHYLPYGSRDEVMRVLDDAVAMKANVVRTFIQPVIGSPDGRMPAIWNWRSTAETSNLGVHGAYMLYWDLDQARMAVNDGTNGLQRIDFFLDEARKRDLKVIVAFLDFWPYTGGSADARLVWQRRRVHLFCPRSPHRRRL